MVPWEPRIHLVEEGTAEQIHTGLDLLQESRLIGQCIGEVSNMLLLLVSFAFDVEHHNKVAVVVVLGNQIDCSHSNNSGRM